MLFLVKDLRASRVNLLMNDFAAGLPSPLSFLGLAAAMAPELQPNEPRWNIGVIPILHQVARSEGRTKPEAVLKGGQFSPIEILEDLIGSVRVSLLLDIPGCNDEHLIKEALVGKRIAGGPIQNSMFDVEQVTPDGSAFRGAARGYALVRTEPPKSNFVPTGEIDALKAFAEQLYPAGPALGSGWFAPVAVGYRLLEDPDQAPKRSNTRSDEVPHVFAEPAVGIAELISPRNKRLTDLTEEKLKSFFWLWKSEGEWIVGHENYHPKNHTGDHRAA